MLLNTLIESVRDGCSRLRTIDPLNERDEWVRQRHKVAEWEKELDSIWPAQTAPIAGD